MIDLKKQIEILISRACESRNAPEAMQFAQAAANVANAVINLDTAGIRFGTPRTPNEFTVEALEHLLDEARLSPTRSVRLPSRPA